MVKINFDNLNFDFSENFIIHNLLNIISNGFGRKYIFLCFGQTSVYVFYLFCIDIYFPCCLY